LQESGTGVEFTKEGGDIFCDVEREERNQDIVVVGEKVFPGMSAVSFVEGEMQTCILRRELFF
jgi:hypothetical protein